MNPIHSSINIEAKNNQSLLRILLSEHNTSNQTSLQNPELCNNKQGQLNKFHEKPATSPIKHLRTSAPALMDCLRTPTPESTTCLRTSALCQLLACTPPRLRQRLACVLPHLRRLLSLRTFALFLMGSLRTSVPSVLLGLRTSALFFLYTCSPAGIDNFQTSRIT